MLRSREITCMYNIVEAGSMATGSVASTDENPGKLYIRRRGLTMPSDVLLKQVSYYDLRVGRQVVVYSTNAPASRTA